MSIPVERIKITEEDLTAKLIESGDITNIVFLPGFAQVNTNIYVLDVTGEIPDARHQIGNASLADKNINYNVKIPENGLGLCSNIADRKSWKYSDADGWVETDYIQPASSGEPILCTSISQFEKEFNSIPYQFKADIPIPFADGEISVIHQNDYDKSYLLAKELIASGVPVYFQNIKPNYNITPTLYDKYPLWVLQNALIILRKYLAQLDFSDPVPIHDYLVNTTSVYGLAYSYSEFTNGFNFSPRSGSPCPTSSDLSYFRNICTNYSKYPSVLSSGIYGNLYDVLNNIGNNKNEYKVKYITTGAYPVFGCKSPTISYPSECYFAYDGGWKNMTSPSTKYIPYSPSDVYVLITNGVPYPIFDKVFKVTPNNPISITVNFESQTDSSSSDSYQATFNITFSETTESGCEVDIDVSDGDIEIAQRDLRIAIIDASGKTINEVDPVKMLLKSAMLRGDCIALIDAPNVPNQSLEATNEDSVYYKINSIITQNHIDEDTKIYDGYCDPVFDDDGRLIDTIDYGTYGAMIFPYANYKCTQSGGIVQEFPGSFGFLKALGTAVRNGKQWDPIAGINNGSLKTIQSLCPISPMTQKIADSYQNKDSGNINGIVNIYGNGYTIWGNRTLKNNELTDGLTATSFINIRSILCDIKKYVFNVAKKLLFEQNNNQLWVNFRSNISPLLDKMITSCSIKSYKIIRLESDEKTKVRAIIKIIPVYAVEEFEVTVQINNDTDIEVNFDKE